MNTMESTRRSLDRIGMMRHPLTGELIRPLGRRANGQLIWPIMGGGPENDVENDKDRNDEGKSGKDESDSEKDESSGNSSTDKEKEQKEKPEAGSLEARIAALEDEKERQYQRRQEEKARADKAEADLRELRDKDKDDGTKAAERVEELESDNQVLNSALMDARKELAFLKDNTHQWHNPSRALALLDLSRVEFDDDGSARGMKDAIEALVKSDPYLIKEEKTEDKDKDKDDERPGKSGDQRNRKDAKDKGETQDAKTAKLLAKYPGLRR